MNISEVRSLVIKAVEGMPPKRVLKLPRKRVRQRCQSRNQRLLSAPLRE